jgi:hypothetical protein
MAAKTVATHAVVPDPTGGSTVTLTIEQSGLLVPLFSPMLSRFSRRYMTLEADGLKRRVESPNG